MDERSSNEEVADATAAAEAEMAPQRVPVNMYEAPEALVIVAPFAAVTADDVTVELRDGNLRFFARLRSAAPREHILREWDYGGYERELELPEGFGAGVEATLANGQLVVRVRRGAFDREVTINPT
jgi:HSP20 family molecular chaperone IbpA